MQAKKSPRGDFSSRFQSVIKQRGIKQKELAAAVSISEQSISRYKKGERIPECEELHRLSIFFGVSMNWLLGDDETSGDSEWKVRAISAESKLEQLHGILELLGEATARLTKIAPGKE